MEWNIADWVRHGAVIGDGATGTILQSWGLQPDEGTETWCLVHPERVLRMHADYLAAGAMWLKTNTFGANRLKYPPDGAFALRQLAAAAVRLAKQAVQQAGKAGQVPVLLSVGPTGKLMEPFGDLAFERAAEIFREVIACGLEAGADAVLVETMADTQEARAAVIAAKEAAQAAGRPELPVLCSLTFEENGRLLSGATPQAAAAILEGLGVQALGLNCGAGPLQAARVLPALAAAAHVPILVNPNAGLPEAENGRAVFRLPPERFAEQAEQLLHMGASMLGGCCGTTPAHIAALAARLKGKTINPPRTATQQVIAGAREVIPLAKCDADALEEYDPEEPSFGPVKITCDDPAALERLLRGYNGRALVIAPAWAQAIAKQYGATLLIHEK